MHHFYLFIYCIRNTHSHISVSNCHVRKLQNQSTKYSAVNIWLIYNLESGLSVVYFDWENELLRKSGGSCPNIRAILMKK
jgi:arginyl-tRNA--protein-N-Asp/Glu arginylyltransferase